MAKGAELLHEQLQRLARGNLRSRLLALYN